MARSSFRPQPHRITDPDIEDNFIAAFRNFSAAFDANVDVLAAIHGGTGLASYAIGDLLYADTTTTLAALADVATGNALISGGVGVSPSYGKVGLTTHISGTLPIANGGTNATSFTSGRVVFFDGTSLTGDADLTFATDTLSATKLLVPTSVSTPLLISTGALGITPASGSNLNVTLATTGDLAVNTNQLYVDTSAGTVGIGTASPLTTLHVKKSTATTQLRLEGDAASINNPTLQFSNGATVKFGIALSAGTGDLVIDSDAFSPQMRMLNSGPVGIGTSTPVTQLEVGASALIPLSVFRPANGATFGAGIDFALNNASDARTVYAEMFGAVTTNTAGSEDGYLVFYTKKAGTLAEAVRIDHNRFVGIGTGAAAEANLEIQGGEGLDAAICLDADDGDNDADTWFIKSVAADNDLDFVNHTSTLMTLSAAGLLSIGGTTPLSKLHIHGASGWIIVDEQDTDPTTTELDSLDALGFYMKNNKLVFAYNNAGTITYITVPLDGATTTLTHGTTAP